MADIHIEREHLLGALQSVIGVVERRQTMPILANLLLSAKQGRLSITATDLEVELVAQAEIKSSADGQITIPGRKFLGEGVAVAEGGLELDAEVSHARALMRARSLSAENRHRRTAVAHRPRRRSRTTDSRQS